MQPKKYILTLFFALAAFFAAAQTCPGPAQRQALLNLQKAGLMNGTRAYQLPMTDTCGNQRYVTLDSIIQIIVDSIAADTGLQVNWYTADGTTTNPLRTATIDSAAQWVGDNADGFLYWEMGNLGGGRAKVDTAAAIWNFGLGGTNIVQTDAQGIDIATSATASRAVNMTTDTVNMIAAFDPTLMHVNLLSDGTYFFADSTKVVGIGQFPDFPSINEDGRDKGFLYDIPFNVTIINGDGLTGSSVATLYSPSTIEENLYSDFLQTGKLQTILGSQPTSVIEQRNYIVNASTHELTRIGTNVDENNNIIFFKHAEKDTNVSAILYFGESSNISEYIGRRAFGVRSASEGSFDFDWIQCFMPNDTTENAISFYNRAYYWKNEHPTGAAGDTLFHFWAATGAGGEAGSDPGFMTLDDIRGSGGGENWYTADGTTTDAHRIATVSGQATWTSDDATLDGLVPYRWEITGLMNEPEMMVWYFDNTADSLLLAHSDVEILLNSSTSFIVSADAALTIFSDATVSIIADTTLSIFSDATVSIGADSLIINNGTLQADDEGDILVVSGADATNRTVRYLEGTFDAEMLSWAAGAAGDNWEAVPANRWSIASTSASLIPSISVPNILIDGAGGGTVQLNYTPAMPSGSYTTIRYIYNSTAASTTVSTDQAWQFRSEAGDLGTSFSLGAGQAATLIWIYNATAANARFFVVFSDGLTNWTESFSSATQATSAFTAANAASDVNAAIIPKGTGAFVLDMPDGASTGGNSRGARAVDMQIERNAAAEVASATGSGIFAGRRNTASGNYSVCLGGGSNTASGTGSFCLGGQVSTVGSVASGTNAGTIGNLDTASATSSYVVGQTSVASGTYAQAYGLQARASHRGQMAWSNMDDEIGYNQSSTMRVGTEITGTAQTELFLDYTGGSERMTLVGNQFWNATVQVLAVTSAVGNGVGNTQGDTYVATYSVGIKRIGSTTSLVGTVQTISAAQTDAGMATGTWTIDADDTNEALRIRFTPPSTAGTTTVTECFATVYLSELRY